MTLLTLLQEGLGSTAAITGVVAGGAVGAVKMTEVLFNRLSGRDDLKTMYDMRSVLHQLKENNSTQTSLLREMQKELSDIKHEVTR